MKNWIETEKELLEIIPEKRTSRYGIIPHSVFLEEMQDGIKSNGWEIHTKRYLTNDKGSCLSGVYGLKKPVDDLSSIEVTPSITFVNSYNGSRKAECRASAMVLVCKNGMCVSTENGYVSKKHIGDKALPYFREHLSLVINGIDKEFDRVLTNIEEMKATFLTKKDVATLIGDMFVNEQLITSTQLGIISKEIRMSEHFKDGSLWSLYNNITEGLKSSHPIFYDKQHIKLHSYISDKFSLTGSTGLYSNEINFNTPLMLEESFEIYE